MVMSRLRFALPLLVLSACSPAPEPPVAPVSAPPPVASVPPAQAAASVALPNAGPPVAPVRPVTDVYFGTSVVDPYRWIETPSAERDAWTKGEADFTRQALDKLPGRAELLARIGQLDDGSVSVSDAEVWGGRTFYLRIAAGQNTQKLYVRDKSGTEKLLFDPDTVAQGDKHMSLDWFVPSLDGKLVAYGVSPSGSEQSVIHVVDATTGTILPDAIDRGDLGVTSWVDGRSFLYARLQKLPADAPPTAKYQHVRSYLHILGTNPDDDTLVFGQGGTPGVELTDDEWPVLVLEPGTATLIAAVHNGVKRERALYVAPRATLRKGEPPTWTKVVAYDDEVTGIAVHGDDLFLLTHHQADRFKVVQTRASHVDLAHAKVVVPEGDAVVNAIGAARDALYVKVLDGGMSRLRRLPYGGGAPEDVKLPGDGAITEMFVEPTQPGALFSFTSWTTSPSWLTYDPAKKTLADTKLQPLSSADFSGVTSVEVKAKSADGTMVPLSIVYPKSLPMDGSSPTYLSGYGSYGSVQNPKFDPTMLAWYERGGVYAKCHVRGGGEYGEAWHKGGMIATKQHTIDDFLGCAQYLIDQKYTSPAHLAGHGRSAGGITIGGAITQRPDLFAAALICEGATNALRDETQEGGPMNIPEFGSVKTEEGFKALYGMDAYAHVKDGTPYPAVLVTTGMNDPRVSPWEPMKMAARLQAATSSGKPVLLRVEYDAGHGIGSTKAQHDAEVADELAFLLAHLGGSASAK